MAETKTFSAAVDAVILEAGRPETRSNSRIIRYVRQSIRELHVKAFFHRDMVEDQITAASDNYVWTKPAHFRMMRTVEYPYRHFPPFLEPGKIQVERDINRYWYAGNDYITFVGIAKDEIIKMAYYLYPISFVYHKNREGSTTPTAPAYFEEDDSLWYFLEGTSYLSENDTTLSATQQQAAKDKVTNWMLTDWFDAIPEGGSAKLFKMIGELDRARSSFALFKSFQDDLLRGEPYASLEF